MKTPRVSVIVPFLNAEKYLRSTVESILGQNFTNWELMIVDDGSTDSSTKIAKEFSRRYPQKIIYLEHPGRVNKGTSASRNLGLQHAQAELVAFLDADDVWMPKMLEHHVKILASHPGVAMSYGPGKWWYSWTGREEDQDRDYLQDLGVKPNAVISSSSLVELFLKNEGVVPSPSGVLLRKEALLQVDGWEESFVGMYDDQVLYAKIGLGFPVYVTGDCLYYYRQNEKSLCRQAMMRGEYYQVREKFMFWLVSYLKQDRKKFAELYQLADDELWLARLGVTLSSLAPESSLGEKGYRISLVLSRLAFAKGPKFFCHPITLSVAGQVAKRLKQLVSPLRWRGFRRLRPISDLYGLDRGTPIDRYYVESFLKKNSCDIKGTVLEIMDNSYTLKFGGEKVIRSDILDIDQSNKKANIHADLRETKSLPRNKYDCIILTQVLQFIDDYEAAVKSLHQMLKPGGVLLCTMPSVSRIDCVAKEEGDYWRFTKASVKYLFEKYFSKEKLKIKSFGNVFVDICFLEGISVEELKLNELEYKDKNFPLIVCVKATK